MNDSEIIQSGYAKTLDELFSDYFSALAGASGDAATEAQALADFRKGVALARQARQQALVAVSES
ncbi:MAG: hypothetical protein ACREPH_05815 [Rhodanobacteraceae bacterium]